MQLINEFCKRVMQTRDENDSDFVIITVRAQRFLIEKIYKRILLIRTINTLDRDQEYNFVWILPVSISKF